MLALALFASLAVLSVVHASIYVTNPVQSSQCTGGQACQVQWTDDGNAPLLSDIGECQVALYTATFQLVQSLPSVNVATASSFTFTPDPAAGPNGQLYYVGFTSTNTGHQDFSATFTLSGMSGTAPGGGSSASASSATGTSSGSSTSAGSSTSGSNSGATTATFPSATSSTTQVTASGTTSTNVSATGSIRTLGTTSASASASATPANAAGRVGSSKSLGGIAALLVLSGVLAL